ncbi:hypothetical protein CALCODRAFT_241001 [Calocera cornea HHB12733]|uniref:Copper transporter n=1 Tax=Calocera cornea HHB12733 TaxID=1353952 RepID=A0A165GU73_9BASI|nr:hypothetical protein CALCODRAFT_241001 [Calocera cornea HHB12733]
MNIFASRHEEQHHPDPGAPPAMPAPPGQQFSVYDIDPVFAMILTYAWISVAAVAVLYRSPTLYHRIREAWQHTQLSGPRTYKRVGTSGGEEDEQLMEPSPAKGVDSEDDEEKTASAGDVEEEDKALMELGSVKQIESSRWASRPTPIKLFRVAEALSNNFLGWEIRYLDLTLSSSSYSPSFWRFACSSTRT